MARSIEQIYQEILLAKDAEPLLRSELTTKTDNRTAASRTAIWQLWCYVFAVAAHSFERLWDVFKNDINEIIDARRLGTPEWYVTVSKDFQYASMVEFEEGAIVSPNTGGLELEVLPNGLPGFVKVERDENDQLIRKEEAKDPENFIIKRASFKESRGDGLLQLKVANETADGLPLPLSEEELSAFENYIDRIKFAGTYLQILSADGDVMTYSVTIYIDSTRDRSELETAVKNAVSFYVNNIPFDGVFVKNELIETVRSVDGVTDAVFQSITFQQAPFASNQIQEVIEDRVYETRAGYISLDNDDVIVELVSVSEIVVR